MSLQCLNRITGACRIESTILSKHWTDQVLIKLYKTYEKVLHRFDIRVQCFESELLSSVLCAFRASCRASTTISMSSSCPWWVRKLSLITRLRKFRSTARGTIFFAIARPSRAWRASFGIANSVKYWSEDFAGFAKTRLNSSGFFSLLRAGKLWLFSVKLYC